MMLLYLCALVSVLSISQSQNIVLTNNGYDDVLIAISDNVPYNPDLIPRIKEVFNRSSALLFSATKYRAYFRNVKILVPSSWNVTASVARTETFEKANIRIDLPSANYGDNPWVSQPAGCGVPGEFMHLTPTFFLDATASQRQWGALEKVIVHEWGHLRWGLYDEYPLTDNVAEHFYNSPSTNSLQATRCNSNIEGRNRHRKTGGSCSIDPSTSLPEKDCRFYPNPTQKSKLASLMYLHFMPAIAEFCDDNPYSPDTLHNMEAPNRQNRLCNMKSSWEVMRESVDFAKGANPGVDDPNFDTSVKFTILQKKNDDKVVVVMDVSGSMEKDNNYVKLVTSVWKFLLYTVPNGTWIGLVKYESVATPLTPKLTQIVDQSSRDALAKLVIPLKNGGTAIGQGLKAAQQILKGSTSDIAGSRIVLLTDGEENVEPYIAAVMPSILRDGIFVDTILLTQSASNNLISLAARTGGSSFFSSGSDDSTSLMDSYTAAERSRSSNPLTTPVTIMSKVITIGLNSTCFGVHVDKSLGYDTTFSFSWVGDATVNITITSPKNQVKYAKVYTGTFDGYRNNDITDVGRWSFCLANMDYKYLKVTTQVESTAPKKESHKTQPELPITVRAKIENPVDNLGARNKPATIHARVSKGYTPVVNAKVKAIVESPDSKFPPFEIHLRDDGASADIEKDDGVYSGYILKTSISGKHSISVEVIGTKDSSIKGVYQVNQASKITEPGDPVRAEETQLPPTDEFERHALAGFVELKSSQSVDLYPPSRINDFAVVETSFANGEITFEWTSVGDDMDEGNASYYKIFEASEFKIFKNGTHNATEIVQTDIVSGNLKTPKPAYNRERVTLRKKNKDMASVYAIVAYDESGKAGLLSNVVAAKLVAVSNSSLVIGLSVGIPVVVILMVILIVVAFKKRPALKRKIFA